ncbi:hypothetical protein [Sphingobium abikonense]|uniref:hypothetical protein n=1 Tax=Sphingobium abikonense TaxID=86193 RepID=UPI0035118910
MRIDLPYPHKALWPNGRSHWAAKGRETKKHRQWANAAMKGCLPPAFQHDGSAVRLRATFTAKSRGPEPDKDNACASLKAYQDGIAEALGLDDRHFGQPVVHFVGRSKNGGVMIEVEPI